MGTLRYIERDVLLTDYDRTRCLTLTITLSNGYKRGWSARSANFLKLAPPLQQMYDRLIWCEILWTARHPIRWRLLHAWIRIKVFFWSLRDGGWEDDDGE